MISTLFERFVLQIGRSFKLCKSKKSESEFVVSKHLWNRRKSPKLEGSIQILRNTYHSFNIRDLLVEYAEAASWPRPSRTRRWRAVKSSFKAIGETGGALAVSGSALSFLMICFSASFFRLKPSTSLSHNLFDWSSMEWRMRCMDASSFFDSFFSVSFSF